MNNRPFEENVLLLVLPKSGGRGVHTLPVPPPLRTGVEGRVAHMLSHGRKNSSTQAQS